MLYNTSALCAPKLPSIGSPISVIKTGDVVRDYFICDKVYLGKFGVETVSEKVDGGGAFSLQLYPTNNEISRVAAEKKVLCGQLLTGFRHCTQFNERFSFGDYYVIVSDEMLSMETYMEEYNVKKLSSGNVWPSGALCSKVFIIFINWALRITTWHHRLCFLIQI
ncbi:uncharacterized protein CELE_R193.1 [Caenorhabditis elegans]|uniref:Uncharacterized protein n=1 Tax=Caenorhabditis elegans TaxID=6239 RepID=Q9N5F4_CAEEL|nr:Uncharacterized protein CELE_R193.1 [Caenorhabditis elegans]CCD63162.2 Uncharacterized protein CELE_R193.1 [Caenorhabditis elegans]